MRMGSILTVGYEKLMLLRTADTDSIAKVISLYIYDRGIAGTGGVDYGLSSAVGIFSSIINILFLVITNKISTKLTDSGLF
jgi:putative aldouronate transport system permease protein